MNDEKVGKMANNAVAKRDEERLEDGNGMANTQDIPSYSENEMGTYQTDELSTRSNGDSSKLLDNDRAYYDTITHDWARNEVRVNLSGQGIAGYFAAIREGNHQVITDLLETNAVTTETANHDGLTPLLAAINTGHIKTVRFLLEVGADPNAYGIVGRKGDPMIYWIPPKKRKPPTKIYRTPLQLAAAKGNLPVVKLLMETYHADDSLIAPDGELALRLASANGHREIVTYLPARRGGGFRRWKAKHDVAMWRAKRAAEGVYDFVKIFVYDVPRFFIWSIPKHVVVLPVVRRVKWLHAHRAELPRLVVDGLKKLWEGVKAFPGNFWSFLKRIPRFMKRMVKFIRDTIVETIKGIPKASRIAALWVWKGVRTLVGVIGRVFGRFFSFLHTALLAIATFFRNVTLKNVRDGFVAFVYAVFVEGPRKLWHWLRNFEIVLTKMLKTIWGFTGELLGLLFRCLVDVLTYLPRKLWEILVSMLRSVGYGGKEVMIWINPKR